MKLSIALATTLVLVTGESMTAQNCNRTSETYRNQFSLQSTYVPAADAPLTNSTPVITLRVNFQVIQKDDGSGNFQDTPAHKEFLHEIIRRVNRAYANLADPIRPIREVCGDCNSIKDARIQFELAGIYYHRNTEAAQKWTPDEVRFGKNVNSEINVYWGQLDVPGTSGVATIAVLGSMDKVVRVTMFDGKYQGYLNALENLKNDHNAVLWHAEIISQTLRHEFGHILMLQHTYNSEIVKPDHPDYLVDVFGPSTEKRVPYHEGGWDCELGKTNTRTSCTNNFMSGTKGAEYLSPLQMGRIHRAIALTSLRNYVVGNPRSSEVLRISAHDTIDFDLRLFRDVIIEPGASLTVTCKLTLPGGAKIIVRPGGKLTVDAGIIMAANGYTWEGIVLRGKKTGFLFFRRRKDPGVYDNRQNGQLLNVRSEEPVQFEKEPQ